jgi:K+ potassium transporter
MHERSARHHPGSITALGFASLGVVFGDIGTSPLYTLKTVLDLTGGSTPAAVLGVLSLIVWTPIAITSIKYVTIAMRIDNDGEGGILALMALLASDCGSRSVRRGSHLWGRRNHAGDLCALRARRAHHRGARARPICSVDGGRDPGCAVCHPVAGNRAHRACLGPVMAAWFVAIALLGVWGITKHPAVLLGLDPRYAISYVAHDGFKAFAVLGGVFLCVTGAEALYADMGHFGATPIRVAWSVMRALRIHGAAEHSAPTRAASGARMYHRSRRRDLLRGTRNGDEAPGRQGPAALAGRVVRLHGAQRLPRDGLFQPAERSGCRNRPPDRDLKNVPVPRARCWVASKANSAN